MQEGMAFGLTPEQEREILFKFLGVDKPSAVERKLVQMLRASASLLTACREEVAGCDSCRAGTCGRHEKMRAAIAEAES